MNLRTHGELHVNHLASPGITEADALLLRKLGHIVPVVQGGTEAFFKTKQCCHCGGSVVMSQKRWKAQNRCTKCDKFVCAGCHVRGGCRPIKALADALVGTDKPLNPNSPLLTWSH
jgi:hypothetical protein